MRETSSSSLEQAQREQPQRPLTPSRIQIKPSTYVFIIFDYVMTIFQRL